MIDQSAKLLGVRLAPGVRPSHMSVFYFSAFAAICAMTVVNVLQPFILTEVLGVPLAEQGNLSGTLALANEVLMSVFIGAFGVLSDRVGRRPIYALGFVMIAAAFALMPMVPTVAALYVFRGLFAIGAAAVAAMLATVVADYPVNADRGRATGFMGVMNGLGAAVAVLVLAKVPSWLAASGMPSDRVAWITYSIVAGFALLSAVVIGRGLRKGRPEDAEVGARAGLFRTAEEGFMAARDPGVALSYAASFVARPDLAIIATFLPLWATRFGAEQGLSASESLAKGGMVLGIAMTSALLFAPVIGIIADRFNRVGALALSLALNAVGYGATYLVTDPFSGVMIGLAVVIGCGQVGGIITSQVLIAEHAPAKFRGSVIGVFGFCGALGIMVMSKLGGMLFDGWLASGPFVLLGAANGVVFVWALLALRTEPAPSVRAAVEREIDTAPIPLA